jgi:hypothetical protein
VRLKHAAKTEAEWKASNPVLLKGEIAYSTDKRQQKTGDGTSKWTELAYDSAVPIDHEHDLNSMIDKLGTTTSAPGDNDYYVSHVSGGDGYIRRTTSGLWEYIKAKANSLYTRIEDFNLLKNTVTDNTKVVNRVKNGINSIINSNDSISVNPSINGMGYAIHRGGSGCVKFDGFELPIYQDSIEYLFDGKSSTYIRFEAIQDYCDIKQLAWDSTKQYKKGDFVVLLNNGNINSYLLFKALSDNTGKNPLENPSIWYDNYRRSTNTYSGCAILRKILIQVEVVLPEIADYETGYSIYFRSSGQTVRDLLVEAGDVNKENWQTEGSISGACGSVVTIYPHKSMNGKKRSIRLSFYNRNDNTEWTAITQIAITGLVGGLEGTVLNKGGGELYGTVKPYQNNSVDLGTSSQKWKNVYATTFTGALSGNASTATKATQDSAGQQINTTYIKELSAIGKTITYTKGDNKTGTATISGFVPMEGTTKDNPMTGAIIQSSTDNGHTYLAGYTPSGSRLISSSSSGTRTTELTPSSFTTNLETGDAETSGALDVTFYPQKNKQMIYLGGSSSDWIIRGVGTPVQDGDAVNKNYIDSTLENWSNDLVEELQGLIPVYGTWEDTPVTGNIVFNGKATVTGVKEPSSDSDVATKGYVDRQNSIKSVTLTAAGWTGTTAPYTQAVKVDGITEDDNPVMVSMLSAGASPDVQRAYNKAFGIICSGTGTTADGSVTFSVYSKPATDITVGLKGV